VLEGAFKSFRAKFRAAGLESKALTSEKEELKKQIAALNIKLVDN
jgi:hypothetical protein